EGSYGEMSGARTPTRIQPPTITPPMRRGSRRVHVRERVLRPRSVEADALVSSNSMLCATSGRASSVIRNSRVEARVDDVRQQTDEYHEEREDDGDPLDDRQITVVDRGCEQAAEAVE